MRPRDGEPACRQLALGNLLDELPKIRRADVPDGYVLADCIRHEGDLHVRVRDGQGLPRWFVRMADSPRQEGTVYAMRVQRCTPVKRRPYFRTDGAVFEVQT